MYRYSRNDKVMKKIYACVMLIPIIYSHWSTAQIIIIKILNENVYIKI